MSMDNIDPEHIDDISTVTMFILIVMSSVLINNILDRILFNPVYDISGMVGLILVEIIILMAGILVIVSNAVVNAMNRRGFRWRLIYSIIMSMIFAATSDLVYMGLTYMEYDLMGDVQLTLVLLVEFGIFVAITYVSGRVSKWRNIHGTRDFVPLI